jgi:hypothetical protein
VTAGTLLRRRSWVPFVLVALAGVVVLVLAALRPTTERTFALGVPNAGQVAVIRAGTRVCESPITSPAAFREVGIFGGPPPGPPAGVARIAVVVSNARTHQVIGRASLVATATGEHAARLGASIDAGTPVRICLIGRSGTFSLLGTGSPRPAARISGAPAGMEFSVVLLRPGVSLLGSLPTAFARASLFKLSWIGSWTFWVLLGALLATIPLGAVAIALVADEDEDRGDQSGPSRSAE